MAIDLTAVAEELGAFRRAVAGGTACAQVAALGQLAGVLHPGLQRIVLDVAQRHPPFLLPSCPSCNEGLGAAELPPGVATVLRRVWRRLTLVCDIGFPLGQGDRDELLVLLDEAVKLTTPAEGGWEGDDWDELEPLPRRLLLFMHSKDRADLNELYPQVWGKGYADATSQSALDTAIYKANAFLRKRQSKRTLCKVHGGPEIRWR
jgi:hypothetical protein